MILKVLSFITIALIAIVMYRDYRSKVPSRYHIAEVCLRRRTYPDGTVSYYYAGKPVPFREIPFAVLDLHNLGREGVLTASVECVKDGDILEDTPELQECFAAYNKRLASYREKHGNVRIPASLLRLAPCDYCQELFSVKSSAGPSLSIS